jgi:hypothetical protein
MKRENPMEAKRKHIVYQEESAPGGGNGDPQRQDAGPSGARTGCSEYSLNLWKKAYLRQQAPAEIDGQQRSPEQMFAEIRRLQKENEYLKRQREILSLVLSNRGIGNLPNCSTVPP